MHIYACICMHAYVCGHMYACISVHAYVGIHEYACICMRMCACVLACLRTCLLVCCMDACVHACLFACSLACLFPCVLASVCGRSVAYLLDIESAAKLHEEHMDVEQRVAMHNFLMLFYGGARGGKSTPVYVEKI